MDNIDLLFCFLFVLNMVYYKQSEIRPMGTGRQEFFPIRNWAVLDLLPNVAGWMVDGREKGRDSLVTRG